MVRQKRCVFKFRAKRPFFTIYLLINNALVFSDVLYGRLLNY